MDEIYRGFRIATKQHDSWTARVTHVRGTLMPIEARATLIEGEAKCAERARLAIDRYIAFLARRGPEPD